MQIDTWPVVGTAEFLAAFEVDQAAPAGLVMRAGSGEVGAASAVAAVWEAVLKHDKTTTMVLKLPERTWVAAGPVMILGKPSLNIGLLMPSLRRLSRVEMHAFAKPLALENPVLRALWAVATRIDRVEVERLLEVWATRTYRFHAQKSGFSLLDGGTLEDFRSDVAATVAAGNRVRYRLRPTPTTAAPASFGVAELLCTTQDNRVVRLDSNLQPLALPKWVNLSAIEAAQAICGHLDALPQGRAAKLTALAASGLPTLKAYSDEGGWSVELSEPPDMTAW